MLEQMVAPTSLILKPDAQVMLVKNVDERLVNGCVGRVLGFFSVAVCAASVTPPAEGASGTGSLSSSVGGKPKSASQELPSSPGSSAKNGGFVRNVQVDTDGRTPVAVNRKLSGKENAGVQGPPQQIPKRADEKRKGATKEEELFPLVEFRTAHGTEIVLLGREEFRVEDNEGKLLARRVQVPLVLAWAMSIHKSQGQTIQRVKIDLGRVFEKGQSYVALSRAASLDGLQVLGFDAKKVKAHPKVIEWSLSLEKEHT